MSQAGVISGNSSVSGITFVEDVGAAHIAGGFLNVVGGDGIQTSGSGNTITISAVNLAMTWQVVDSTSNPVILAPQNGYFADGGASVQFYLPPAANVGATFIIAGEGNLWTLAQNANQQVILGIKSSTVGVGGSVTATTISDTVTIVCMVQNQVFKVINMMGNPTVV